VPPLVGELWALIEKRWRAGRIGLRVVEWVFHRDGEPIRNFYGLEGRLCGGGRPRTALSRSAPDQEIS